MDLGVNGLQVYLQQQIGKQVALQAMTNRKLEKSKTVKKNDIGKLVQLE